MVINMILLFYLVLGGVTNLVAHVKANDDCPIVPLNSAGASLQLNLSTENTLNCFTVRGDLSENYRVKIWNHVYGRFEIGLVGGSIGYAWGPNADGIYYCARGGSVLAFDEFPTMDDGTPVRVSVSAEMKPLEDCFSDYIAFDGIVPVKTTENGDSTEIFWSGHKYFLKASHFEYKVKDEDPITMKYGKSIVISGDPGNDEYISIEVEWIDAYDGKEKRFFGYIQSDGNTWNMYEARVYDATEEWVYFTNLNVVSGSREECFYVKELILTNNNGDEVKFLDISLATFLQWGSQNKFYDCIDGIQFAVTSDESGNTLNDNTVLQLLTDELNVNPFQIQTVLPQLRENDPFEYRIAAKNQVQKCEIVDTVEDPGFSDRLESELGVTNSLGIDITTLVSHQSCASSDDDSSGAYETGSGIAFFSCAMLIAFFTNYDIL